MKNNFRFILSKNVNELIVRLKLPLPLYRQSGIQFYDKSLWATPLEWAAILDPGGLTLSPMLNTSFPSLVVSFLSLLDTVMSHMLVERICRHCKYLQQPSTKWMSLSALIYVGFSRWRRQCWRSMSHKEDNEGKGRWEKQTWHLQWCLLGHLGNESMLI